MKEHVHRYARAGLFVFPLAGKVPVRGTHGYKSASRDASQIDEWWGERPTANIGIATGRSGLVVIDLDLKNGVDGFASLDVISTRLGVALPRTKLASTPNRGAHLYYRVPEGVTLKNGAAAPGLDVCVHQITAPPSTINGKSYSWDVFNVPTPELPEAFVREFAAPPPYVPPPEPIEPPRDLDRYMRTAIERESETLAHAGEGTRNQALCRFAFVLATIPQLPSEEIRRAAQGVIASWQWTHSRPNHRKNINTLERGIKEGRARPRGRT